MNGSALAVKYHLFITAAFLVNVACAQTPVPFNVDVTVLDPSGAPLADCPVEIGSTMGPQFTLTGPDGRALLAMSRDTDEAFVALRISPGLSLWDNEAQKATAIARFKALRREYAWPDIQLQAVGAHGATVSVTLQAQPAVRLQGKVVIAENGGGMIAVRDYLAYTAYKKSDGTFDLRGVPQATPVELWISGNTTQAHFLFLDAAQTVADAVLEDFVVSEAPTPAFVEGQLTNVEAINIAAQDVYNKIVVNNGITFVSTDGSIVQAFALTTGEVFLVDENGNNKYQQLPMSVGTYYAVPGKVTSTTSQALLESVRAGRQSDLDAAGVPKVVFTEGQTTSVVFDAAQAVNAVIQVGADLLR